MNELTRDELNVIKARLQAATPGPWSLETLDYKNRIAEICSGTTTVVGVSFDSYDGYDYLEVEPADAEFIAHARTDVARLVVEVERLQAGNAKAPQQLTPEAIVAAMRTWTDERRMEVLRKFCRHCGDKDPYCQCWNDE